MTKKDFKNIYDKYGRAIRNYIYYRSGNQDIADDITQDVFIKVWKKQYNHAPEKIRSLLYKIANGMFVDYIRKNKVEIDYVEDLKFQYKNSYDNTDLIEDLQEKITNILRILTEKERTVFLLNKKDGYKYTEIAKQLDISVKAVEKRMSKALKKIKQSINM